jgi:hypothetical protein
MGVNANSTIVENYTGWIKEYLETNSGVLVLPEALRVLKER